MAKYKDFPPYRKDFHNWKRSTKGRAKFLELFNALQGQCPDCKEDMFIYSKDIVPLVATFDHIIPLVYIRKHTVDNLRICCWLCNQKKDKTINYVFET